MDSFVSTQLRGVVGKEAWTGVFVPKPDNVRPWGVQRVPIPHEISGEPGM